MVQESKRVVVISEENYERIKKLNPEMTIDKILTKILNTIEEKGIKINF